MASMTEKAKKMAEQVKEKAQEAMGRVKSDFTPEVNKIKGGDKLLVLAALPKGGSAAKNPKYLHCVENALGLTDWARSHGATLIATDDVSRSNSEFDKQLPDAQVVITTPYYPVYLTRERLEKAKKLELIINLRGGSEHIDLQAAADRKLTVIALSGPYVDSVAEDEIMRTLIILRNFVQGHDQVKAGQWDPPSVTADAYDLENRVIGTVGAGKVGTAVMKRLQKNWDAKKLVYHDINRKSHLDDKGVKYCGGFDQFLGCCDVVLVNVPLTDKTRGMFNKETISKMKQGAVLVNDARGAICDTDAVVEALKSGHLKGYGGDTWPEEPPPANHVWRTMPRDAMTPHMAGLTIDAQERYSEAIRMVLSRFVTKEGLPKEHRFLVREGKIEQAYE